MPSEATLGRWVARLGLVGALLWMTPLHAQTDAVLVSSGTVSSSTTITPPAAAIDSVERADRVLVDVSRQRTAVAVQYAQDQQACYAVFLMTRCLDAARERRRDATAQLRAPEIEANAFKRRTRVAERDQALEEKRLKAEQEATAELRGVTIGDTRKAGAPADKAPAVAGNPRMAKPPMVVRPERQSSPHQPKPLTAPISPAAQASNIASFDRKTAESAERQRTIAEKKAEKERDRVAKKARAAEAQPVSVAP